MNDNTTVAPQTTSAQSVFNEWTTENLGDMNTLYEFLTTPSAERSEFIGRYAEQMEIRLIGNIVMEIF